MEDNNNSNNTPTTEETSILNLREIILQCLKHWRWYAATVGVAIVTAFIYIKATPPTYKRDASIMVLDAGAESSALGKMLADFKVYYNEHNTDYTVPYPGICDMLEWLQEEEVKIAVASNKYDQATQKLIRHFFPKINFAAIEGQKEGIPVKPDPSIVFSILAQAKEKKADTL